MKKILIFIIITISLYSCKTREEKAVNKLDEWFGGYDSVKKINNTTRQYIKYTELNMKEVTVESIVEREMDKIPDKQQIEFHDQTNNTESYYEWDNGKSKIIINVLYTNPETMKGMRYLVTVIKK